MLARELKRGDLFKVDPPDPEGPIRICLFCDEKEYCRWGFPDKKEFWCWMGMDCPVTLVGRKELD